MHVKEPLMNYDLDQSIEILSRTPATLDSLLRGAPDDWTMVNNGGKSWSAWAVVGHMVSNEEDNWIARARFILENGDTRAFEPFDREGMFEKYEGTALPDLLDKFRALRTTNLETLRGMNLTADNLQSPGLHPTLGKVTLSQLLSTWVAHDMNHMGQIVETLSRHYKEAVGPWIQYLAILTRES
jgi:uncharacterized damage-inducible protein DinB